MVKSSASASPKLSITSVTLELATLSASPPAKAATNPLPPAFSANRKISRADNTPNSRSKRSIIRLRATAWLISTPKITPDATPTPAPSKISKMASLIQPLVFCPLRAVSMARAVVNTGKTSPSFRPLSILMPWRTGDEICPFSRTGRLRAASVGETINEISKAGTMPMPGAMP